MKEQPRIPAVGEFVRQYGTLVEVQLREPPPPPPPDKDYIFESTDARIETRINGLTVKDHGTYGDFYGKGRGTKEAIETAKAIAAKYAGSGAEVVVVEITERQRYQRKPGDNFYSPAFVEFERLSHGWGFGMPPATEVVVWSSLNQEGTK